MDEASNHDSESSNSNHHESGDLLEKSRMSSSRSHDTNIPTTTLTAKKANYCEREIWDVKKLENPFPVQLSVPSLVVKRMLESRQKRHEESNSNMWQDIGIVNGISEKCFAKISDHFQKLLDSFKFALLKTEESFVDKQIEQFNKKDFSLGIDEAKKLFAYRRNIIDLYCQKVMQVEKIRSEKIRTVLRFYMQSFNKISHLLPNDIQNFFEYEILKYNETMMGNVRYYGDIHLQLVLSGDNQFLKLKRTIEYLEEQWDIWKAEERKESAFSASEYSYTHGRHSGGYAILNTDESEEIQSHLVGDSWEHQLFQGIVCRWADEPDIPHATYSIKEWTEQRLRILMHLDLCAQKIILLMKSALLNLLKGLQLDFESLKFPSLAKNFINSTNIHDVHLIFAAVMVKLKAKLFHPSNEANIKSVNSIIQSTNAAHIDALSLKRRSTSIQSASTQSSKSASNFGINIQTSRPMHRGISIENSQGSNEKPLHKFGFDVGNLFFVMEQTNDSTKNFLCNAAEMWHAHFERSFKCSQLVAHGVNRINNDAKGEQSLEILYNTELDRLRQEYPEEKLEKSLQNVNATLDNIQAYYEEQGKIEKEILEHYPKLIERELEVCRAEMEKFLTVHPKVEVAVDLQDSQEENLTVEADERKGDKVPQFIKMCIFQLEASENWKLGLFECMEHYTTTSREDFLLDAQGWVTEMMKLTKDRMEMKKQFLLPRYERVRLEVHNVRLVELQQHSESLKAHQLAVEQYLSDIGNDLNNFVATQIKCLEDFVIKLEEMLLERDASVFVSNHVAFLIKKTDSDIQKFIARINGYLLDMEEDCHSKIKFLKEANVNFIKSIKMFSEGGNFSAAESKDFLQELIQIAKFLDTEGESVTSKISSEGSSLLARVRAMVDIFRHKLKNLYDDLVFVEKTSKKISWLQGKMEREVSFMKKGSETLIKKKTDIEIMMLAIKPCLIEPLLEKWYELIESLQQRNSYLLKSEGSKAKLTTVAFDSGIGGKTSAPSPSDYRNFLGWDKPTESETFLNCVRYNLWDLFGEIQDLANKYYSTKSEKSIVKTDLIPHNLRAFLDELLEKCKFYLIQCEEAWLDQLRGYLVLVTKMGEIANLFIKLAIEGFMSDCVRDLDGIQSTFLKNMNVRSMDRIRELAAMERRLMPLYGHPGNSKMLTDLHCQVMEDFQNLVSSELTNIFSHQEDLKQVHSTYDPRLNEFLATMSEFSEKVFDRSLAEKVALQLEEVCEDSMKIIEMDKNHKERPVSAVSRKTEESKSSCGVISLAQIPSDTVISKEIPKKYKLNFEYNPLLVKKVNQGLKNILNKNEYLSTAVIAPEEIFGEMSDKGSGVDVNVHVNSVVSLQTPEIDYETGIYFVKQYDMNEYIRATSRECNAKYNDCLHKITQEILEIKSSSKEWLKNWKQNVQRVKKVYTVSYDTEKKEK